MNDKSVRWYPTHMQLKDPQSTERSFRETLRMLYELQDSHEQLKAQIKNGSQGANKEAVPAGNSASDQRMLGLPVEPSDTTQLADGTVLTYVAATRSFKFL